MKILFVILIAIYGKKKLIIKVTFFIQIRQIVGSQKKKIDSG